MNCELPHVQAVFRKGRDQIAKIQIRKGVCQGCILSPCLFNLYAEYIMRNARLDEAEAGSRFPGEISLTKYTDDTTLMAESEEELKSLLMKGKEESKKLA